MAIRAIITISQQLLGEFFKQIYRPIYFIVYLKWNNSKWQFRHHGIAYFERKCCYLLTWKDFWGFFCGFNLYFYSCWVWYCPCVNISLNNFLDGYKIIIKSRGADAHCRKKIWGFLFRLNKSKKKNLDWNQRYVYSNSYLKIKKAQVESVLFPCTPIVLWTNPQSLT